jgi:acyl-CoA thioester hydrolase
MLSGKEQKPAPMIHPHPDKFSHSLKVSEQDIDILGHVNNVVYLRYVQEVATAHWHHAASEALQQKYLWVVLRHEIDYLRPAFLNEEIIGYTWVGEHQGAKFDRYVTLCHATTGKVLAEAKTTWCLLDAATLRPKRIDAEILAIL